VAIAPTPLPPAPDAGVAGAAGAPEGIAEEDACGSTSDLAAVAQESPRVVGAAFSKAAAAARVLQVAAKSGADCELAASDCRGPPPSSSVDNATQVAGGAPPSSSIELETLLGEWRDSMGNRVYVEWSKVGGRHGQLDVLLTKLRGGREPIRLNVKKLSPGRFSCGHYDLDMQRSHMRRMVWTDCRSHGKHSVWER